MAGDPKISGPQEREREIWKTTPRRNVFTTRGSTVPSGEPSFPQDKSELQPSARVFEEMRERDHSSACEEDSPRERGP
jgi:hypothetical protein